MERRLAAILMIDMVGYSRLAGLDEEGTIARQKADRDEIIGPKISMHGGRVVKATGDGLLVEFPSVVGAVKCAVEVQEQLAQRETDIPEDRRVRYRMGINLGDIVIDGDDILGDGVNVAARLEGLSEPGGICISGAVYDQVKNKIDIHFQDIGKQHVKNIDEPVQAYKLEQFKTTPVEPSNSAGSSKSAIAVMPFVNMSGDPEQEYFADGITEDIITALSGFRTFSVQSRSSTFAYKGRPVGIREIGRQLNVNYILDGSVRRAGNRIRVTAQLIDTAEDEQLWAKRCDGNLDDIFDLQDRITSTVVGTIEPELVRAEGRRLQSKPPEKMLAYDWLLRGQSYMHKVTPEDTKRALQCFEKAVELDPSYGRAYAFASWAYRREVDQRGFGSLSKSDQQRAIDLARKALRCDRSDPFVLVYAAITLAFVEGHFDEALPLIEEALAINPNFQRFWNAKSMVHAAKGDTAEAIAAAERAIAMNVNDPAIWVPYWAIAQSHLQELRFDQAADFARQAIRHNEFVGPAYYILAAALANLGRQDDAETALARALEINPGMTLEAFPRTYQVERLKNLDVFREGLHRAKLPD